MSPLCICIVVSGGSQRNTGQYIGRTWFATSYFPHEGRDLGHIGGCQCHVGVGGDGGVEGGGRAVVQVRRGVPGVAQGRRVQPRQRRAQALAAARLQRAHVVHRPGRAVRVRGAAMALAAARAAEQRLPGGGRRRQAAVGIAVRAARERVQRGHVGRQPVQVRALAGLGRAQGGLGGRKIRVGHQPRAAGQGADLALKVLDFVKICAPVQPAMPDPGAAAQVHRIAQTLAQARQVPDPAVVAAVVVAGRAAQVSVARQPEVLGVVKQLLAGQDRGRQLVRRHRRQRGAHRRQPVAPGQQARQVHHADGAVHKIVDVQRLPVRRQPPGRPAPGPLGPG